MYLERNLKLVRSRRWMIVEDDDGDNHVMPVEDVCAHVDSMACVCKPRRQDIGGPIVHNAFDGRKDDRREEDDDEWWPG